VTQRRVAIVGTRPATTADQREEWGCIREDVFRFVQALPFDVVLVSGGASGVDKMAEHSASGREFVVHPADWNKHGKAAGPTRNQQIVDDATEIHAWPSSWSRGTWDTIRKAKASGKVLVVHEPFKVRS